VPPGDRRRFQPERIIAFGSRVRGETLRSSDLDVIIVAHAFEDVPWLDRQVLVQEAIGAPFAMDTLCYRPAEFDQKRVQLGLVQTAVREGLELYSAA
jgi:hypothetical protein